MINDMRKLMKTVAPLFESDLASSIYDRFTVHGVTPGDIRRETFDAMVWYTTSDRHFVEDYESLPEKEKKAIKRTVMKMMREKPIQGAGHETDDSEDIGDESRGMVGGGRGGRTL